MSPTMIKLICGLPYLITIMLLIVWMQPSIDSASRVNSDLSNLSSEYDRLSKKLKEKEVLLEQKRRLDRDIQRMRASVPPTPEMDILLLDLERLSDQSGTDLISIEPNSEKKKDMGENLMDSIIAEVGGRLPLPPPPPKPAAGKTPRPPVKVEEKPEADPLGIMHVERRIFVTGDYNKLTDFLKRLENYQRIVGIRNLIVAAPEDQDKEMIKTLASERGKKLGLDQPVMTFLLSAYYLP